MLVLAIVLEESPGTIEQHSPCKRTKGDLGTVQQKHTAPAQAGVRVKS